MTSDAAPQSREARLDGAAFGAIYGAISVLALLAAVKPPVEAPARLIFVVLGSVAAVAFAKTFATVVETAIQEGRPTSRADLADAWRHGRDVFIAAIGPVAALLLASLGVVSTTAGLALAQAASVALLAAYGARVGARVFAGGGWRSRALSALICGGVGLVLSGLKYLAH